MADKTNILITDDHPVYRSGLKNILRKTGLFDRIFEASNGKEAVSTVEKEDIAVVMMDIEMDVMNGVDATAAILKIKPLTKVVALTMFSEPKFIYQICKNGAKGYLLKDAHPVEITKAINMILNDEEYYSPRIQSILAQVYRDLDRALPKFDPDNIITTAQSNVLKLLCAQYSSEEIANELGLSVKTVNRHRQDLLLRTKSINLAGLVIYAIEHSLIKVNRF